jgi:signal peptidase I
VAETDGSFQGANRPVRFLIFNLWQTFVFAEKSHTIWFPPDYGSSALEMRAGVQPGEFFKRGDDVFKLKVAAGDHLFVDRLTYNFRPPQRGEIIVFETKGIPEENREAAGIPPDQFYIKRLVALGGETVQIGPDRHLVINGKPLDASTPLFNRVYGFNPNDPPRDSHYSGHVYMPMYARFFDGKPEGVQIPPDHFMVMGDNTMNSLDSRAWGWFPSEYVIGRAFLVYWPFTSRFGFGYRD